MTDLPADVLPPSPVVVRSYADVKALTTSPHVRQFGGGRMADLLDGQSLGLSGHYVGIPLELNGDEHTQWRRVLNPLFAPRRIAALEPTIRALASELIDTFAAERGVDAYASWCEPLPSRVFLDLMGISADELARFVEFKRLIIGRNGEASPDEREAAFSCIEEWFASEFDRRVASGASGDDVIDQLLSTEIEGRPITRGEMHGICSLLMIAGLDTVAASLACVLAHLALHPERRARLVADSALWPSAIEELLRIEAPVTNGYRHVVADVDLPSGRMSAGTNAVVRWDAANRDPAAFTDPDDIDFARAPNQHLAFASGPHRCLGMHLARVELRVALEVWHERLPQYHIPAGVDLVYSSNPRAPEPLPLEW